MFLFIFNILLYNTRLFILVCCAWHSERTENSVVSCYLAYIKYPLLRYTHPHGFLNIRLVLSPCSSHLTFQASGTDSRNKPQGRESPTPRSTTLHRLSPLRWGHNCHTRTSQVRGTNGLDIRYRPTRWLISWLTDWLTDCLLVWPLDWLLVCPFDWLTACLTDWLTNKTVTSSRDFRYKQQKTKGSVIMKTPQLGAVS